MTCVCRGLTSRLHQAGGQPLQPTVFVETIPELAAERRRRRDVDLGALRSSYRKSQGTSPAPNPKPRGE